MDPTYVAMAGAIYGCATNGFCKLAAVTGQCAEAWLGDIDSPVVFLGGNPNRAEHLPYHGTFEEYIAFICTALPQLWAAWWPATEVLRYISEAAGVRFAPDLNNICVFNPIHCVTADSKELGRYAYRPEELPKDCVVRPLRQLLQRRPRVLVAHGGGALEGLRIAGLISRVPTVGEAAEWPAFEVNGHLVITTYHLMSNRGLAPARRTMPIAASKIRAAAGTIQTIIKLNDC